MTTRRAPLPGMNLPPRRVGWLAGAVLLISGSSLAFAATITVPNFSFESQLAPPPTDPFPINPNIDNWQKTPEPSYWSQVNPGTPWNTAESAMSQSPFFYTNANGGQTAYVLGVPGAGIFQDSNSTDWQNQAPSHAFNATFTVGQSYQMTLGVFGKNLNTSSFLDISLYYVDGDGNRVRVQTNSIQYDPTTFAVQPNDAPNTLVDYSVNVPTVQAGNAWAGKNIGIEIASDVTLQNTAQGFAYWDMDNVRLTSAPEPGSIALLALAAGGFCLRRSRSRRSA